jgi:hypothetical protein
MKPIIHTAIGGLVAMHMLAGTAAASTVSPSVMPTLGTTDDAPVVLEARPGSEADSIARQLMAPEIRRSSAHGHKPLVLVGMGRLNDEQELLFVQLQSLDECGSGGCNTVSFKYEGDRWVREWIPLAAKPGRPIAVCPTCSVRGTS